MERLLEDKNAIIYGAGGGIGRGVARTFAREGARVFLAGRTRERLETVAADVERAGGRADVAVVNTLDEEEVAEHARVVADLAGSLDVSWNLTSRGDVQGIPLVDMQLTDFIAPIATGVTTTFITARAAARIMVKQGSGVILALTSGSSRGTHPMMGGTGPADAATETFLRYLAAEVGKQGVRVVGLWTAGVSETFGLADDTNPSRTGLDGSRHRAHARSDDHARPCAPAGPGGRDRSVPGVRPRGWDHRDDRERHLRARAGLSL